VEDDEIARLKYEGEIARLRNEGEKRTMTTREFGMATLGKMIEERGSAWGGYQRLRVGETTDELVKLIAGAAGFDERSSEFLAIRYLAGAWRASEYDPYGTKDPDTESGERIIKSEKTQGSKEVPGKFSENRFLFLYDLEWRLRRLKFVMSKIDDIACFDDNALKILSIKNKEPEAVALLDQIKKSEQ